MNLQKKLANLLATIKRKRPYYCEVEYLETTGTQYIDTGVPFHFQEDTVTLRAELTALNQYQTVYGINETIDGATQFFGVRQLSTQESWQGLGVSISFPAFTLNKRFTLQISRIDTTFFQYEGDTKVIGSTNSFKDTTRNGFIFATNNNGNPAFNCIGKIYSFQQRRAGILICDLIPVLDWDMKPCMYDKISGELLYNVGEGEFLCGREIHQVEYLESTGTQYIDTGYSLNTNTDELYIDYTNTSEQNYKWMFGEYESGKLFGITSQNVEEPRFAYGSIITATKEEQYYAKHTLIANSDGLFNDGIQKSSFKSFEGSWNIYLFALNNTGTSVNGYFGYGKIYSYAHKRNGSLIRDFIPAIDENGVGFMFDRVSHTIFDNAGTGAFVYPPVELEYLESNGGPCIDTGINPTDEYGYHIRNTYRYGGGEQCAIGCMDAGNRFVGVYTGGQQISGGWGSFVNYLKGSYKFEDDTLWDVYCNYKNDRQIIVNDEILKDLTDIHIEGTITNTIYLFGRHYGNNVTKMYGRIYEAKITKGSDVVAHFIPCIKDGQLGMWDKVNRVFHPNIGTGTFIGGKVKNK